MAALLSKENYSKPINMLRKINLTVFVPDTILYMVPAMSESTDNIATNITDRLSMANA